MSHDHDVNVQDPAVGDGLLVEEEGYQVADRCPCASESGHIRWFLEGEEKVGSLSFPRQATLAKEWDDTGEIWWWFGRRISASDLRIGYERLPQWLRGNGHKAPERVSYAGKRYHLVGTSEPSGDESSDPDTVTLTLWEYADSDDIDNILIERSDEGELSIYHGAYYDPSDLLIRSH